MIFLILNALDSERKEKESFKQSAMNKYKILKQLCTKCTPMTQNAHDIKTVDPYGLYVHHLAPNVQLCSEMHYSSLSRGTSGRSSLTTSTEACNRCHHLENKTNKEDVKTRSEHARNNRSGLKRRSTKTYVD